MPENGLHCLVRCGLEKSKGENMSQISVIIPIYNAEDYLDECIESVINQDYHDFELLLIDDGSTDKSLLICEEWRQKDSRIKIFSKKNGGVSDARNFGLSKASGEYITFVDSDDYISRDYLSYLKKLFEYSNDCSIVACNRQMVKDRKLGHKFEYGESGPIVLDKVEIYERGLYTQIAHGVVAKLFKKEVFINLRFPLGLKHEDTYMLGDFINISEYMVLGSRVCYFYRVNEKSIVHTNSIERLADLIKATTRFAEMAVECDGRLRNAAICKVVHAKLSALSLAEPTTLDEKNFMLSLKGEILENKSVLMNDRQCLKRDKIAIILLAVGGIPLFRFAFCIYRKYMRNE